MKKNLALLLALGLLLGGCQSSSMDGKTPTETPVSTTDSVSTADTVSTEASLPSTSSTTENQEPSDDSQTEQLKAGAWNLTKESYYTDEARYVSWQNESYVYDQKFEGFTEDRFAHFHIYGGYQGPHYENYELSIATFDVECSTPENLYEPGDTVKLIMRCETDSDFGKRHDPARVYFSKGNGKEQGDKFIGWSDGYFEDKDGEDWSHQWNTTTELYGKFPVNPQDGDVIAIVFDVTPASGMDGSGYEQNYGGHMFYEWIYTYIA